MKHLITEGDAYYGNGEADCFTCWSAGKVLLSIGGGQFLQDVIQESDVELLKQAARDHAHAKPGHDVRVFEFRRGVGQSNQTVKTF